MLWVNHVLSPEIHRKLLLNKKTHRFIAISASVDVVLQFQLQLNSIVSLKQDPITHKNEIDLFGLDLNVKWIFKCKCQYSI